MCAKQFNYQTTIWKLDEKMCAAAIAAAVNAFDNEFVYLS